MTSYFVVAIDYGRRGIEAVVQPEMTRRGAIDKIKEALGDNLDVVFVHFIEDRFVDDVTDEIKDEAQALRLEAAE